jgi:hypothetical protein
VSPSSANRRKGAALAALLALATPAGALGQVRLDVAGALEPAGEGILVRVDLKNGGDAAAQRVDVEGELLGQHAEGHVPSGLAAGAAESVRLHFLVEGPRPGVHALALHLRYPLPGQAEPVSQRAYLLLALGARPEPAVRLTVLPAALETAGPLPVRLESADGRAHLVRLRVLTPRGVNALAEVEAAVPAAGTARAEVPLVRAGPARRAAEGPALLGVVVLAASTDDGVENTAAATATVSVTPYEPWMPRLRIPIAVTAVLLLLSAALLELRRRGP